MKLKEHWGPTELRVLFGTVFTEYIPKIETVKNALCGTPLRSAARQQRPGPS
jgi:hypothetical protein